MKVRYLMLWKMCGTKDRRRDAGAVTIGVDGCRQEDGAGDDKTGNSQDKVTL